MTQDEIIAMAKEAGAWIPPGSEKSEAVYSLVRFAALVAAKEREACAQLCESWADEHDYAVAIRARSTP